MEVLNTYAFDFDNSLARIDEYLATSADYEHTTDIKKRQSLTFNNGYYLDCYALFVDIRDSSSLTEVHQKKVLAKLYRTYISELSAVMQSSPNCREINIVGDCVNGIYSCSGRDDVMEPFHAAFTINGLIQAINLKSSKRGYAPLKVGIGLAKGTALMIKAGYSGSGINDVVWMGDVVNFASHLCDKANKDGNSVINVSQEVYDDLEGKLGHNNVPYQSMLKKVWNKNYYTGNVILVSIEEWINKNK